jgi:small-conductance mechanosensitive channel
LVRLIDSLKRFAVVLSFLVVLAVVAVYFFDVFAAAPFNVLVFSRESFRIIIIIGFWLAVLLVLRRAKPFLIARIGIGGATVLQLFLGALAILIMSFGVLGTFGVSPESLLAGAGIASVTIGLIVSTFVGGILSGALVFTTHPFRVGDDVFVNNVPGIVIDMTALVTRVRTDIGDVSIPNSAIASGSVMMVSVHKHGFPLPVSRLPYRAGDRVVSTYMSGEGVVKELTPVHTVISLDSGKELTFLNNSVLTGSVAIARISEDKKAKQ